MGIDWVSGTTVLFVSALTQQTKLKTPICNQRTGSWCNLVFQIVSKHMSMRIGGAFRERSPVTTIVATTRMCKHVPVLNQSQTPQDENSFMPIGTQNKQIKSQHGLEMLRDPITIFCTVASASPCQPTLFFEKSPKRKWMKMACSTSSG